MGIKFATEPLAIEQNNYATKIVNSLDVWSKNPTINFKFKTYLVCASNIVKIVIKKSGCIVALE